MHYFAIFRSQAEAVSTHIDDCPQDTIDENDTPSADSEQREATPTESNKGE